MRAVIEIEPRSDPIAGTLIVGEGPARPFVGWMEMIAALEALRELNSPAPPRARSGA